MTKTRVLINNDFDEWLEIYRFYAEHYEVQLTEDVVNTTWGWLMDKTHPLKGLVAEVDDRLIGLAHYRAMPRPLWGKNIGFLDDIIVAPAFRGSEAAKLLLNELKSIGCREKWGTVRWITRDNNYRARALYDKVALKTDLNIYEMNCGD